MQKIFFSFISIFFLAGTPYASNLSKSANIRVLSLDGGGIRGYLSIQMLKEIEKKLPSSLNNYVDWYAGTSTGAIIAAGLCQGKSIQDVEDFYRNKSQDIFMPAYNNGTINCISSIFQEKYTSTGLDRVLEDAYGAETTLADLNKGLVVTSYDIEGGKEGRPGPYVFNSKKAEFQSIRLTDIVRASAAAPTYFLPFYGIQDRTLLDGAMIAANPSCVATNEILSLYDDTTKPAIDAALRIVSIGTGIAPTAVSRSNSTTTGLIDINRIFHTLARGTAQRDHLGCEQRYGERYVRLDSTLPHAIPLDGATEENFSKMESSVSSFVYNNPELVDQARDLLQG